MNLDFLLIDKIKKGNKKAAEEFVRKYYSCIYQYCLLHIRNQYIAEDMTQETFLRFFEAIDNYKEQKKIKNYLYVIAGNCIKNYFKKKKEIFIDDMTYLPETDTFDIELRLDIEKTVDNLPEDLKEIAILFFFQQLKQREIADLLNISLPLVKYRIREVKKIFSHTLKDYK